MKRARQTSRPVRRKAPGLVAGLSLGLVLGLSAGPVGAGEPDPNASAPGTGARDLAPAAAAAVADGTAEPASPSRGAGFDIRWHTLSAGGGEALSSGGGFQLRGSIGQHSASPDHPALSATYRHRGGFWVVLATRGKAVVDRLFRDRFQD